MARSGSVVAFAVVLSVALAAACGDDEDLGLPPGTTATTTAGQGGAGGSGGDPSGAGGSGGDPAGVGGGGGDPSGAGGAGGAGGATTSTSVTTGSGSSLHCPLGTDDCDGNVENGCEQSVIADPSSCGGCGNACAAGFTCNAGKCLCGADAACGGENDCVVGSCVCGGTTCTGGQTCGAGDACSCNGGPGCASGQTCCTNPSGCFDLGSDPANCGACGRSCPAGFTCDSWACHCGDDASCDAGSAGQCVTSGGAAGKCKCGNTTCELGERCQPGGTCGF